MNERILVVDDTPANIQPVVAILKGQGTSAPGNPAGEIYGKVVEVAEGGPWLARVCFTSTTPELKAWVTAWAPA